MVELNVAVKPGTKALQPHHRDQYLQTWIKADRAVQGWYEGAIKHRDGFSGILSFHQLPVWCMLRKMSKQDDWEAMSDGFLYHLGGPEIGKDGADLQALERILVEEIKGVSTISEEETFHLWNGKAKGKAHPWNAPNKRRFRSLMEELLPQHLREFLIMRGALQDKAGSTVLWLGQAIRLGLTDEIRWAKDEGRETLEQQPKDEDYYLHRLRFEAKLRLETQLGEEGGAMRFEELMGLVETALMLLLMRFSAAEQNWNSILSRSKAQQPFP
ncbi:MAG: hypothetical protein IPP17_30380 [Bacteroidetes bacterium]|nr:hypothetical protein [Bacteroidota bacterium]